MAKTKDGKKRVFVHSHKRGDSSVRTHYRSTPNKYSPHKENNKGGIIKNIIAIFFKNKKT